MGRGGKGIRPAGRRLRVGQFLAHFPAPGGTSTVVGSLAKALAGLGHAAFIYAYGRGESTWDDGVRVRVFPPPSLRPGPLALLPFSDRLTSHLASNADSLDVMIVHGMFGFYSRAISRACGRAGIACIADPHDPYSPDLFATRRLAKLAFFQFFEHPFLNRMSAIEIHAPSHAEHLRHRRVAVPTFVLPWGLPAALAAGPLPPADQSDLAGRDRPAGLVVLYLGRWDVHHKGLDLLLDAVAGDEQLRSQVTLWLAGKAAGRERATVERMVSRLGPHGRVAVLGYLADPWATVRSADLVVLPSRFDGFGLVVIEALALGTPVLVSSRAGVSEFVDRQMGAVVVEPQIDALRVALRDACETSAELRQAAVQSRQRVVETFDWMVVARRWLLEVDRLQLVRT
jgi:glycosyltransferase involved in cell wall biosynthesis